MTREEATLKATAIKEGMECNLYGREQEIRCVANFLSWAYEQGVEDERERCAGMVEDDERVMSMAGPVHDMEALAAAIRQSSQPPQGGKE